MSSASLYSVTAYCFAQPRSASSAAATKCLAACSSSPAPRQWRGGAGLAAPARGAGERRAGLADLGRRLFDELRDVAVALASACTRLEVVGDVANEDVLERPLHVSFDPGNRIAPDEVAALQRGERCRETARIARDALERSPPEDPTRDRGVEDDLPFVRRKRVETCRDEAADRAGQGLGRRSAFAHHGCELLDEERVPLRGLCHLSGLRVGPEEVEGELRSITARERLEGQGVVGEQAAAPGRPHVEQLRT